MTYSVVPSFFKKRYLWQSIETYRQPLLRIIFKFFFKLLITKRNSYWNSVLRTFFLKDFIYLFLDRGREGEGKKSQCVIASCMPPTGVLAHNAGCVLTGNQTGDSLVHRPALNPLSHTSLGSSQDFLMK